MYVVPNGTYYLYRLLLARVIAALARRYLLWPGRFVFILQFPCNASLHPSHGFLLAAQMPRAHSGWSQAY